MFTGIVQEIGKVQLTDKGRLQVEVRRRTVKDGESIAVDGVCLTVVGKKTKGSKMALTFDLTPETLQRTRLGRLKIGSFVNIEYPLSTKDALGGHLVQGHVDGVGQVDRILRAGQGSDMWFRVDDDLVAYLVPKGSVAVNGVSLTVVELTSEAFSVALIPYTLKHTNLGAVKPGDEVNLEIDIIAKYVARYVKK